MDDQHFDELVKRLGTGLTRRRTLRTALAGLAATVTGAAALEAEAKKGKGDGKSQGKDKHQGKQNQHNKHQGKAQGKDKHKGKSQDKKKSKHQLQAQANNCPDDKKNAVCHCPEGQGGEQCKVNCVGTGGGHENHEFDCMCDGTICDSKDPTKCVPTCASQNRFCPTNLPGDPDDCGQQITTTTQAGTTTTVAPPPVCSIIKCSNDEDCIKHNPQCECTPGTEENRVCRDKTTTTTAEPTTTTTPEGTTTTGAPGTTTSAPPCNDSCSGKKCGQFTQCGRICGGCEYKEFCVLADDGHSAICKHVPSKCVGNGKKGICCSGYHKDGGVCCDANDAGAVAITVTSGVFNSINVSTPATTVITTVNVPVTPGSPATVVSSPSTGGAGKRKRRRRRKKGGRR